MSEYTPAPWPIQKCECGHKRCKSWLAGPELHAEAVYSEMDARLIAAAPEMLEALKGALTVADRKTKEFDAVRSAIAKAEGNSSD